MAGARRRLGNGGPDWATVSRTGQQRAGLGGDGLDLNRVCLRLHKTSVSNYRVVGSGRRVGRRPAGSGSAVLGAAPCLLACGAGCLRRGLGVLARAGCVGLGSGRLGVRPGIAGRARRRGPSRCPGAGRCLDPGLVGPAGLRWSDRALALFGLSPPFGRHPTRRLQRHEVRRDAERASRLPRRVPRPDRRRWDAATPAPHLRKSPLPAYCIHPSARLRLLPRRLRFT